MYGYDERVGAIELAASIGTIAALINVRTVNRLGMDYSSKQELQATGLPAITLPSKE